MNGSSSTYLNEGSHPFIQGLPSPLTYLMYAIGESPSIISSALNKAIEEETETVKKEIISEHPQYAQLIDDMEIEYDEETSTFVYATSDKNGEILREMEYGTQSVSATAAIRKALLKGAKRLEKQINLNIAKELGE